MEGSRRLVPTMGHGVRFGARDHVSVVMENYCKAFARDESLNPSPLDCYTYKTPVL